MFVKYFDSVSSLVVTLKPEFSLYIFLYKSDPVVDNAASA